jgi:signal transduction histidine kinase
MLIEKRFRREIEALSHDIEKRIAETLAPINEANAPQEIRPLINAINRLIAYFEDRSHHEQDFSANASHELRTPLAGIRLQTEIAMSTKDLEIQQKAHQNVLHAIDQNERLIEQLMTLARLTADRVELAMKKVNLRQLCTQIMADLASVAKEKHITLTLEMPDYLTLFASEESISILLHNLIRNAIHYIPEGGFIEITAHSAKDKIILSVSDNGPGIAADKYDTVLRRFQKAKGSAKSGSGLGLAIVKRICELHHAALKLGRANKKGGLIVTIIFPR